MRFIWFNLMPWPYLPDDFRERYRSVWVDIPSALYDPVRGQVLMGTERRCDWDETYQGEAGLHGLTTGGRRIRTCGSGFQGNVSSIPLPSGKLAGRHSRF